MGEALGVGEAIAPGDVAGEGFGKFTTFTELDSAGSACEPAVSSPDGIGIMNSNPCSPIAIGSICQNLNWCCLRIMYRDQRDKPKLRANLEESGSQFCK